MTASITPRPITPRRSVLYMPGANQKALAKAQSLECDAIIMDIEDAVAPEAKGEARENIIFALKNNDYGKREIIIRTNGIATEWFKDDLKMAVAQKPDAILIPKVSSAEDLFAVNKEITALGGENIAIWAMIETPLAILNIAEICQTAAKIPFTAMIMGTNDLAKEMMIELNKDRTPFLYALSASIMAARAFNIAIIDGVFNDIADLEGLKTQCEEGKALGFDGKTLIHPSQIDTANQIFAPRPEEIEQARAVVTAFSLPENRGKGVIKVNGKMTEILHYEIAKRTLAMAEKIAPSS